MSASESDAAKEYEVAGVEWGVRSDIGHARQRNEDSYLAKSMVFAVADGMGGHDGGDFASALAIAALSELQAPATVAAVRQALVLANDSIMRRVEEQSELAGMGTTIVGLVEVIEAGERFWLGFNIGDSRLYRFVGGDLSQVSHDHSVVQELIDAGDLAEIDARTHPDRSMVTRALGFPPEPQPDFWLLPDVPGQAFLLCSDGLCGVLSADVMANMLGRAPSAQSAATALVDAALDAGVRDNVTALVVRTNPSPVEGQRREGIVVDDTIRKYRSG